MGCSKTIEVEGFGGTDFGITYLFPLPDEHFERCPR